MLDHRVHLRKWKKKTAILLLATGLITLFPSGVSAIGEDSISKAELFKKSVLVPKEERSEDFIIKMSSDTEFLAALEALPESLINSAFHEVQSFSVPESAMEEVQETLQKENLSIDIEKIYEDVPMHLHKIPVDPLYSIQWNMRSVEMETAWDTDVNDNDIIVAMVDSGVTPYDDLTNVINGADLSSGYLYEDTYPGQFSYDGDDHGTAGATMIAAAHNSIGLAGVHPNVKIMGVKVFPDGSSTTSSLKIAAGIIWAADHGAHVINLSVGSDTGSSGLLDAINYARSKGVVLVASSGNDGYYNKISYPAAYAGVLAVGSTNQSQGISYFSNEGMQLDLVAPGESVPLYNNVSKNYGYYNGTSFSAPMVSGAAAFLLSITPTLSAEKISEILTKSATDLGTAGWDSKSGYGLLNVKEAVIQLSYEKYLDTTVDLQTAERMYPNEPLERYFYPAGDTDYYIFTTHESNTVTLDVQGNPEIDVRMRLLTEHGENIMEVDQGLRGESEQIITELLPGTYFVELSEYVGAESTIPYELSLRIQDVTAPIIEVRDSYQQRISHEGLSISSVDITAKDTSIFSWEVFLNGDSKGNQRVHDAEGNYRVVAEDAAGNRSFQEFVLDLDGYLTIDFENTGDTVLNPISAFYGTEVSALPHPSKEGYIFEGWYRDPEYTTPFGEKDLVRKNLTLYGKWMENGITGIVISKVPDKVTYLEGEELDIAGLEVLATYRDGSQSLLEVTSDMVSGYDKYFISGEQKILVTMGSFSTYFYVSVRERVLERIEITTLPLKTEYVVGDDFDSEGLVVTGYYEGEYQKIIENQKLTFSPFNSSLPVESQEIRVYLEDKAAEFSVRVVPLELETLEIQRLPDKLIYMVGDELDLRGLEVIGTYNNGNKKVLDISEDQIIGFSSKEITDLLPLTISFGGKTTEFMVKVVPFNPIRTIAGVNRYSTAVEISKASYGQSDVAILVQARNFPDALAAGPLAYTYRAPILLTSTIGLNDRTLSELERLQVKKVILMGGEGAISREVERNLQNRGYETLRVFGSNRYNTAVETAKNMEEITGKPKAAVLTSGTQFADALSAGSFAAKNGYPILLTNGSTLNAETLKYLSSLDEVIIVGGSGVIKQEVRNILEELGLKITAVFGANRSETSTIIGEKYFTGSSNALVANGWDFADALAAAPYAAKNNMPMILVHKDRISSSIYDFCETHQVKSMVIVGGDAAVSGTVREALKAILEK